MKLTYNYLEKATRCIINWEKAKKRNDVRGMRYWMRWYIRYEQKGLFGPQ